jgi:hypothetical protein
MNTKSFFSKIREIIREEIEYALDKKMANQKTKKSDISSLEHGLSLYKEVQTSKKSVSPKQQKTQFGSINDLLEETRRTLQESSDMDNEFHFTADMAEGFGYERGNSAIPHGYNSTEIPTEVMSALTRDYSALMKKIDEKKGR